MSIASSLAERQRIYFPGLNGIRFLAAFAVVICHIEEFKGYFDVTYIITDPFLLNTGNKGVTVFFTLSGFLITYLLMVEKETKGQIHVKRFYMRRMLRIWPLYLLIVLLSFFVLPHFLQVGDHRLTHHVDLYEKLALYLAFLPHAANILYPHVLYAWHLWSIGVEEQFYLFWPFAPRVKSLKRFLFGLIAAIVIVKSLLKAYSLLWGAQPVIDFLRDYLFYFRVECFAAGGLFAYYYTHPHKLRALSGRWIVAAACIAMLVLIWVSKVLPFSDLIFSMVSGIVIINVIQWKERNMLEHPALSYLGRISYGIYMFHPIAIGAASILADELKIANLALQNSFLYTLSIGGTIALASLSYHLFESRFLKLKNRYNSPA